jgi:two-component system, response regulator YesN
MYKVFIADDESLVITSLKSCVDWEALGFMVIGTANDGISAYENINALKPDIVFADIRMPGMSGLELIKQVYSHSPDILFVIISGYAEFAYVQKALSYGVLGYCLKPFDENEITLILNRAKETLEKTKAAIEMEFIGLTNETSNLARARIRHILEMKGLQISEERGIIAAVSIGPESLVIPAPINHIQLRLGANKIAYLFHSDCCDDFVTHFKSSKSESVLGIGLSRVCYDESAISDVIEDAYIAANQYFMTGRHGIYSYEDYNQDQLISVFSQLENHIVKRDINMIQKTLDALETELSKGIYNINSAFQVYNIFMYSFYMLNEDRYDGFLYDYVKFVNTFQNIHGLFQYLKDLLKKYTGVKTAPLAAGAKNDTFSNIISFVNEHFCEEITIHTISEEFAVNPNYVSQLFKKQTEVTFTEYITTLRVNFACNLLKTTDLSVAEIADRVRFSDYYYFTRVFKKLIGETPTAYREKVI